MGVCPWALKARDADALVEQDSVCDRPSAVAHALQRIAIAAETIVQGEASRFRRMRSQAQTMA